MLIIGCDLHSRYQVIAMLDTETGEVVTRRLQHENGEAKTFYASLPKLSLVGIEATGYTQWFERLLAELGHERSEERRVGKECREERVTEHVKRKGKVHVAEA